MLNLIKRNAATRGFTLIEVIIYSALIAIIIGYSLGGVYSLIQDSERLNDRAVIDEEANFLLKKFEWALSSLETINVPASGLSGNALSVSRYNFGSNPIIFDLDSNSLRVRVGNGQPIVLNNDRAEISSLVFEHLVQTSKRPSGVKATLIINGRTYSTTIYKKI